LDRYQPEFIENEEDNRVWLIPGLSLQSESKQSLPMNNEKLLKNREQLNCEQAVCGQIIEKYGNSRKVRSQS